MTLFPASPSLLGNDVTFRPVRLGPEAFLAPFYDDGAAAHLLSGASSNRISLDECPAPAEQIRLTAIIFHLSHCGSTLMGQLLSLKPSYRVISEAEIVNSVLLSHVFNAQDEQKTVTRLQKAVSLLLQPLNGQESGAFLKLTSWNILYAPLIIRAFPGVPLWYMHRDPSAVLLSLLRDPQGFAAWNLHAEPLLARHCLGLSKKEIQAMNQEDFIGHMLLKHMQCAVDLLPADTLLLPYPEWIEAFPDAVGSEVTFTEAEITMARDRLRFDAKKRDMPFSEPGHAGTPLQFDQQLGEAMRDFNAAIHRKWSSRSHTRGKIKV